jgi:hypothetical protein
MLTATEPGAPPTMYEVFISYASANQAIAQRLVAGLEKRGLSCWIASREILPGHNYQEKIPDAIEACHAVLVLYSRAALKSSEIPKELVLARKAKKWMTLLRIEDVDLVGPFAYEFGTSQYVDMFNDFDTALNRLCHQLDDWCGKAGDVARKTQAAAKWRTARTWSFRTALVAAACVGAAAAWQLAPALHPGLPAPIADATPAAPPASYKVAAATPILPTIAMQEAPAPAAAPVPDDEARAIHFADRYFAVMSAPPERSLDEYGSMLADPVLYYGKSTTKAALLNLRGAYQQRWPERKLVVRPATVAAHCDHAVETCTVTGLYDYVLSSVQRHAGSAGVERFSMQVFGSTPLLTTISVSSVEHHSFDPALQTVSTR